jgi:hypothetical protein
MKSNHRSGEEPKRRLKFKKKNLKPRDLKKMSEKFLKMAKRMSW